MSEMEPEVKQFMQKIIWTLSAGLLWLLFNVLAGLKWELAFWNSAQPWKTILFYSWFIVSIVLLLRLYHRWWKDHI